jgi:quinol monooxygenase YgiN
MQTFVLLRADRDAASGTCCQEVDDRAIQIAQTGVPDASENGRVSINKRRHVMVTVALFVRLEAKPGREKEVESFLAGGLPLVMEEPATTAWFGIRLGQTTFGIFDAFPNEAGRQAHLSGKVAAALMAQASELFSEPPTIEKVDVIAAKLPS